MVLRPEKIERQLNQRNNAVNLEPLRWNLRIVQILPVDADDECLFAVGTCR
jgi:hypothetical protein